jgi:hypothetical protein
MMNDLDYGGLGSAITLQGHASVRSVFSIAEIDATRREAANNRAMSEALFNDSYVLRDSKYLVPRRRIRFSDAGEHLLGIHDALTPCVSKIVSKSLFPTRAGYVYYEPGGFLGVHVDEDVCEYTLLANVGGPPDPLRIYPSLMKITGKQLADYVAIHGFSPQSGWLEVDEPSDGFLLINGAKLPHARPVVDACITILALCYSTI